jgi:EAL domain-containing protein (putative c-di-GMP-specific phosphodiesterase class I)
MPHAHKGRVLLAEDEPGLLRSYRRILDGAGYEVEVVDDGAAGVALFKSGTPFDVVISDVSMPGMSGLELLRQVHEHDRFAPVVLMTGGPTLDSAIRAVEYGALKYLTKPFAAEDLLATVSRAIAVRQAMRLQQQASEAQEQKDRVRADLDSAFDRMLQGLWIAVQPIVSWPTRTVLGHEALMRSVEPALPHPGAILVAAEELGRVVELGRTVRQRIADTAVVMPPDGDIYVNLHPSELCDEALYDPAAPLSRLAARVVLEVTERASLKQLVDLPARVRSLRNLGYRLALDDLGAGYAALNSISALEPQVVKIDMGLVRDVHVSITKQKIIQSITQLCHSLEIRVVAEGIECPEERDALALLGVDLMQGYYFARPGRPMPEVTW